MMVVLTKPYTVQTSNPPRTHQLWAQTFTQAVFTALELSGPGSKLVRCVREVDW